MNDGAPPVVRPTCSSQPITAPAIAMPRAPRDSCAARPISPRSRGTAPPPPPSGGGGARLDPRSALAGRGAAVRVDAAVHGTGVDRGLRGGHRHGGQVGDRTPVAGQPLRPRRQLLGVLEDLRELVLVERLLLEERG